MAKAFMCDNCKKFFSFKEPKYISSNDFTIINNVAFSHVGINGQRLLNNYDICPECAQKIFDVLPGIVKKEKKHED